MQHLHLTCPNEQLLSILDGLSKQFQQQADESVSIVDYGHVQKRDCAFIVLAWPEEVDEAFLTHLNSDPNALDYSVYTLPYEEDDLPYSMAFSQQREREAH